MLYIAFLKFTISCRKKHIEGAYLVSTAMNCSQISKHVDIVKRLVSEENLFTSKS